MTQGRFQEIRELSQKDENFARRHSGRSYMLHITLAAIIALGMSMLAYLGATGTAPIQILAPFAIGFVVLTILLMVYTKQLSTYLFSNEFENALFAGAANTGMEFMLIFKQDQGIVYYSPSCRNYFNQEVLEVDRFDIMLELLGVEEKISRRIIHTVLQREHKSYELMLNTKHGKSVLVDFVLEPITRPRGFYVCKAFRMSVTSNYRPNTLTRVFDEMTTGVYKASDDGTLYYVNPAFAQMLGHEGKDLADGETKFRDLIFASHVLDQNSFNEQWQAKVTFKHKNGKPVIATLKQLMVPQADDPEWGLLRCGFVVSQGSESSASDDEDSDLKTLSAMWSQFLETSPIGIVLMDEHGNIRETNAAFRKTASRKITEQIGLNIFDVISDDDKSKLTRAFEKYNLNNDITTEPLSLGFAENLQATADFYLNPIEPTNKEENAGFIGYLIDTSEQQQFENKLIQSQKMQAVGQLAGGIAHDFNNLLTAMIGFCDLLLLRHPAGEQSFADIMQIKQNANRAANLVRQLLAFSRKQTLQPELIDVTDTVAELTNLLSRLIGENIELDIVHGRDLWKVKADTGQLEQVIINLAVNARDAMAGKGKLTVKTYNRNHDAKSNPIPTHFIAEGGIDSIEPGEYVAIEVTDTGCGMPKKVLEQIFEPFFTTKELGKGTGLGLSTVIGIIEQTGGHVLVSSQVNKGTSFMILLKHHEQTEGEKAILEVQAAKEAKPKDLTGSGKILLVEDEAPVRMFSSRALINKGYEVLEAENAEMGLELIEEHGESVDLIISDVMMPGISGPEMVTKILETHPDISVVFISGYGEDEFIRTFGDARDFDFLPKPFTLSQIASKVKEIMEKRHTP